MVDIVSGNSPYTNLQPFGGSAPVEPESRPQSQFILPAEPGPVQRLRDSIERSEIDTEEFAARAVQAFGEDGQNLVSETGEIDLNGLSSLIALERTRDAIADVTNRYGQDAAKFVSDTGKVDLSGLKDYLQEQGIEEDPTPPQTGFSGADITGYSPQGQAQNAQPTGFVSVVA